MTQEVVSYIGLGSNLADPIEQLYKAKQALAKRTDIKLLAISGLYRSAPMGPQNQPDYINAVAAIRTGLPALVLLHQLQTIENKQGRLRNERWGARTLDLDILLYGDYCLATPELTVPHVGLTQRAFVLYPLYEIAPELQIPGKKTVKAYLAKCPLAGLQRLDNHDYAIID